MTCRIDLFVFIKMNKEPIDKYFGVPLEEWVSRIPNELEFDAVGFWQIVPVGRDSFGLKESDLDNFVRKSVIALVKKGARPVRPAKQKGKFWEVDLSYGMGAEEIAENVIAEWHQQAKDPDEDGLWFSR